MRRASTSQQPSHRRSVATTRRTNRRSGFTLLELMIAILVASLAMAIAIPALSGAARRDPLTRALNDLLDAFHDARSRAILDGISMQVVFHATDGRLEVQPAPVRNPDRTAAMIPIELASTALGDDTDGEAPRRRLATPFHASFSEEVAFRSLVVNTHDMMGEMVTTVRFHPNGTCDQFDAILRWPGRGERHISLEVTTGLPEVEDVR